MKTAFRLSFVVLCAGFLLRCTSGPDPSASSSISLKMSATTSDGSNVIGDRIMSSDDSRVSVKSKSGVTLTDVKANIRDVKFDFDRNDKHFHEAEFRKDSSFSGDNDPKLKGPFLVDLMNAGTFVDQIIASINLPNAKYEQVRFKLVPDSASGDMMGKSIMITGKIDTIPFIFWHKRDLNFGARFNDHNPSDSTLNTTGTVVTLAIHFEVDKVLDVLQGGVDLVKAVDGNKDGIITIDPNNDDGNKWLADQIMMHLVRHARCERRE